MSLKWTSLGRNPEWRQRTVNVARQGLHRSLAGHADPYDAVTPEVWERPDVRGLDGDGSVPRCDRLDRFTQQSDPRFILFAKKLERHVQRGWRHPSNCVGRRAQRLCIPVDGVANGGRNVDRDEEPHRSRRLRFVAHVPRQARSIAT